MKHTCFFYKHRGAKHRRPENRPKVKHILSIGGGPKFESQVTVACDLQNFRLRRPNFAKFSPAPGFFSKIIITHIFQFEKGSIKSAALSNMKVFQI